MGIEKLGPYWKAIGRGRQFSVRAVAREPRTAAISRVEALIHAQRGDILDFKMFSDLSVNLLVDLSGVGVTGLVDALAGLGWPTEVEPPRDEVSARLDERLEGTVQVTFPEGEGALRHPQPAVPG